MTFEQIIHMWPSTAEFGRDIGITVDLASKYRRERGIPSERWRDVLQAASRRGLPVTFEDLLDAQEKRKQASTTAAGKAA